MMSRPFWSDDVEICFLSRNRLRHSSLQIARTSTICFQQSTGLGFQLQRVTQVAAPKWVNFGVSGCVASHSRDAVIRVIPAH